MPVEQYDPKSYGHKNDNTHNYDAIVAKKSTRSLFPVRDDEPAYAQLNDPVTLEKIVTATRSCWPVITASA